MTEPVPYGIASPDDLKEVEIWITDTIENILPHIYRPLEQIKKKKNVSNKPPIPEELYPEPVANMVMTWCAKVPDNHPHGCYLISEHVFHECSKVGPGWKGFYQFVRRKYKPVKFKEEYSIDATKVVDGIWSYAQTKILEHTEKRPIKKQAEKKKRKKKTTDSFA